MQSIKIIFTCLFSFWMLQYGQAQGMDSLSLGSINIYQAKGLSTMLKTHKSYAKYGSGMVAGKSIEKIVKGYSVQIANTTNRTEAMNTKSKFLSMFPNIRANLVYNVPYYKLRVGQYVDRKDAESMLKQCRKYFDECFVIQEDLKIKTTIKPKEYKEAE